jgi:hypothetical protein
MVSAPLAKMIRCLYLDGQAVSGSLPAKRAPSLSLGEQDVAELFLDGVRTASPPASSRRV